MWIPKSIVLMAVGVIAGATIATGATIAISAGASNPAVTYYGCVNTRGALSKVSTAAPTCPARDSPISWNSVGPQGPAGPGGFNGLQEFTTTGTWTAPSGVTGVLVEAAGGGGGAGTGTASGATACGGGTEVSWGQQGGTGGYAQSVVPVTPGTVYAVQVGAGGTGAALTSGTASGGTDSELVGPGNIALVDAQGGSPGANDQNCGNPFDSGSVGPAQSGSATSISSGGFLITGGGCKFPLSTVNGCGTGGAAGDDAPSYPPNDSVPGGSGNAGDVVLEW